MRILFIPLLASLALGAGFSASFDHGYARYGDVLSKVVRGARVDYQALGAMRAELEAVVAEFGAVPEAHLQAWSRERQMAYWINAYNLFTLKAIIDHYPIRGSWLSLYPRDSIRQIDGVWTDLRFHAAGMQVTLDHIEHGILRPTFKDARVHFAVNCASISCPPLAAAPYVAERLDAQLNDAARRYLESHVGLQIDGKTLRVSNIFDWYGDDFIPAFANRIRADRPPKERAILAVVAAYGPPEAKRVAKSGDARVAYLRYDWSLNDVPR